MAITKAVRVTPSTANKLKNVAEYVSWQINLCGKMQTEIAEEVGFEKPNVISMIKQGKTKVPINKIGKMAKALNVDPIFFLKMCINEYMPDMLEAITAITNQPVFTANEIDFIEEIRASKIVNPKLETKDDRARFREFLKTLKGDNGAK